MAELSTPPQTTGDFRSLAFRSPRDTADVKKDLKWQPVADKKTSWQRSLGGNVTEPAVAPQLAPVQT